MAQITCKCGTVFEGRKGTKYCSETCRNEAAKKQKALFNAGVRKRRPGQRECHDCGKPTYDFRCPACWQKLRQGVSELHRTDGWYIFA